MIIISTMIDDENDREFMKKVYEANRRLMYSVALRYTSSEYDCEDIVHDTVEKLCKNVSKLKSLPAYALQAYISYSVRNTAINFQKHQAVLKRHVVEYSEDNNSTQEAPDVRLERIDELKRKQASLMKIWDKLSERDRDILYRKYVFDQTTEELAELYNCSRDSVRMRLSRAKRRALVLMEEGINNDKV